MKTSLFLIATSLLLTSCGKDPDKAAFTGTWNFTEENSILNVSDTVQVTVVTLPPKFRLSTKSQSMETTSVYDGASIHTKTIYMPSANSLGRDIASEDGAPDVRTESAATTQHQAAAQRFWVQPFTGSSVPGGVIAGRDTVLHESKWKRPDGEFSTQIWIDAKTGVMLKSIESIYSSQAQTLVRRSMKECVSIEFTPPAEAAFAQP